MTDHSLTLEQFIALNDEIAAIARVGVPLEIGLRELGASCRASWAASLNRYSRNSPPVRVSRRPSLTRPESFHQPIERSSWPD